MADFSLGQAILGTGVDLSGIQKGLSQAEHETEQKAGGLGSFFGSAFSGAAGNLIASGIQALTSTIGLFVTDAFAGAREAQQLMAQTSAVITSTGGAAGKSAQEIADLASSLSDAAGKSLFGDDQIQSSENLLLTFTNIKGAVFDTATAISVDMAQALGGAPKDQAVALGKALNDPIAGITALSRVGVTFTDQQKKQIKTMQDAGDMAGAQGVILAELNKEVGGSAKAAAAATGGWSEFKGRLGEAGEMIATAVLPLLGQLGTLALNVVMPVIEGLAGAFSDLVNGGLGVFADDLREAFGIDIGPFLDVLAAIQPIFQGVLDEFAFMLGLDPGAWAGTWGGAFDELIAIVRTAIGAVLQFSPTFEVLRGVVEAALPPIQDIVTSVFGIITGF